MQWNLRQHLEEAERQRRLAAGLRPTDEPTIWHEPSPAVAEPTPERDPLEDLLIDLRDPTSVLTYRPATVEPEPEPAPARTLPRRSPTMALPVWQHAPSGSWSAPSPASATVSTLVRPDARATNQPDLAGRPRAEARTPAAGPPAGVPHDAFPAVDSRTPDADAVAPRASRAPVKDRCPHCGGSVRLDMFDLDDAVARMSCTDCGLTYSVKSPNL